MKLSIPYSLFLILYSLFRIRNLGLNVPAYQGLAMANSE